MDLHFHRNRARVKRPSKAVAIDAGAANRALLLAFLAAALYCMAATAAFAQDTPMGDVLCTVVDFVILGNLGRGLATIAVLVIGVGATLGKVSWGLAITVAVGVAVMYGAPTIAGALLAGGGNSDFCWG